ncbi:MAG: polysaccharide biosynthesis protein [Candidatus Kapaibacterium sp.]|nr:MAG: polysaccharide biosynthesis protein [Candidatus Kapabacteria bacterium]
MRSPFRQLAKDSAIYGTSTVVQRLLTFLLTPLYTNVLAPAALGDVAQLYSLMAVATAIATLGFEPASMRYWVEHHPRGQVLWHSLVGVSVLTLGLGGLGMLLAPAVGTLLALESADAAVLVRYAIGIVALDALAAIPFALLRMERRARTFALLRVLVVTLNVGLNVLFVALWHWGVEGVMLAGLASSFLGAVMVLPLALPHVSPGWNAGLFRALLRFGLPMVPAALAALVVQVADRPILGWLAGAQAVGIYTANYRLAIPMMLAVSVYETAWRPLYLHHANDPAIGVMIAQAMRYFLAVAVVLYAAVALFIGDVVAIPIGSGHLIGAEYWSGLGVVPIVLGGYAALGISTTMAASIHLAKRTELLSLANGAAAVTNVLLNLALIPPLGYIGAAWATAGAYTIGTLVTARVAQRVLPIAYPWAALATALGTVIALGGLTSLLPTQGAISAKLLAVVLVALVAWRIAGRKPDSVEQQPTATASSR